MERPIVIVVDDEEVFRDSLVGHLQGQGYRVLSAGDGETALRLAGEHDLAAALVDFHMPGMDGLELMARLKAIEPATEVIIVTGETGIDTAVEAMRQGAYHYLAKPVRLNELEQLLRKALQQGALQRENRQFRERNKRGYAVPAQEVVISESPAMRDVLAKAKSVAPGAMPILITGETGVGKEVIAAFIHHHSPRFDRILSTVNCGALTDTLMDAELFGHEKGAFTGATESRLGMLEVADGGTLFLDEIGEMPLPAQVRLLRFLEQGVVRRVGATRERRVNVRVIAATHRDLAADVTSGRFREDLFHRLCVIPLHIPPLRERREDILPLAQLVLSRISLPGGVKTLDAQTEAALLEYPWPGNVRELAHAIERAVFNATQHHSDIITPEFLQLRGGARKGNVLVSLKEAERLHIAAVLEHFQGNRQKTAQVLGVSERHLYRLIREMETQDSKGVDRTIPA